MTTDKKAKSVDKFLPVESDCVGLAKLATDSRKGIWKMGDALTKLVPQTGIHWKQLNGEKASEAKAFEAVSVHVGIAPTTLKSYRNTAIAFKVEDRNMEINFSIYKELASLANTKGQYAKTVKWINSNPKVTTDDAKAHRKAINGSLEPVITKGTKPAPSVESSSDDGTTPNATATDVEATLAKFNESISTICSNRELFTDHEKLILNGLNKLSTEFGLIPVSPYKKDKVKN